MNANVLLQALKDATDPVEKKYIGEALVALLGRSNEPSTTSASAAQASTTPAAPAKFWCPAQYCNRASGNTEGYEALATKQALAKHLTSNMCWNNQKPCPYCQGDVRYTVAGLRTHLASCQVGEAECPYCEYSVSIKTKSLTSRQRDDQAQRDITVHVTKCLRNPDPLVVQHLANFKQDREFASLNEEMTFLGYQMKEIVSVDPKGNEGYIAELQTKAAELQEAIRMTGSASRSKTRIQSSMNEITYKTPAHLHSP